jgi:drug/metabolite transporter (DMT)-like permease
MSQPQPYRPFAAALWMLGSIAAFSAMAVAGRSVKGIHDTFELMLWRSVAGLVVVVVVVAVIGRLGDIRSNRLGTHAFRNVVHFTGQNLWFYALNLIPLAQVFALEFTSPIWVILMAAVFLGERLTGYKVAAAALGFGGVWVVARPDFAALDPGVVTAALSAVFFAATSVVTKRLTRVEGIVSILFWLTLMQTVLGAVAAGYDGHMVWPTMQSAHWLVLLGLAGLTAHFCLTRALSLAPASVVVPVDFARLPVIAVVGWAMYSEAVEWTTAAGAALILCGILVNLRGTATTRPPQSDGHRSVTPRQ